MEGGKVIHDKEEVSFVDRIQLNKKLFEKKRRKENVKCEAVQ